MKALCQEYSDKMTLPYKKRGWILCRNGELPGEPRASRRSAGTPLAVNAIDAGAKGTPMNVGTAEEFRNVNQAGH